MLQKIQIAKKDKLNEPWGNHPVSFFKSLNIRIKSTEYFNEIALFENRFRSYFSNKALQFYMNDI